MYKTCTEQIFDHIEESPNFFRYDSILVVHLKNLFQIFTYTICWGFALKTPGGRMEERQWYKCNSIGHKLIIPETDQIGTWGGSLYSSIFFLHILENLKMLQFFQDLSQMPILLGRFSRLSNQISLTECYLPLFYGLCKWIFKFSPYH